MISVAVVGPESTGKTTLTKSLSEHFKSVWVKEYARDFLSNLGREYDQSDLLSIASGQLKALNEGAKQANGLVLQDTDLLVIKIWSQFKYGNVNPWIELQHDMNLPDFYILTFFDIPYEEDPLRETPEKRAELFEIYESELKKLSVPYFVVKGSHQERLKDAIHSINSIL